MAKIAIQGRELGTMVEQVSTTASDQDLDRRNMQNMNDNMLDFDVSITFSEETSSSKFPDMNRLAVDFT